MQLDTYVHPKFVLDEAAKDPQYAAMSAKSEEIVKHFGTEAPSMLNDYACALEDVIIRLTGDIKAIREEFALEYDEVPVDNESDDSEDQGLSNAW